MRHTRPSHALIVVIGVVGVMAFGANAQAQIGLSFDTLPSAQGWTFYSGNRTEPEIFSIDGGVLTMDSLGPGTGPEELGHRYIYYDVVNPDLPFTITITARVLQIEAWEESFGFAAFTGTKALHFGIGPNAIRDTETGVILSNTIDNTDFHTYRVEASHPTGYEFFVDGDLIGSGPWRVLDWDNWIDFGDRTRSGNAYVEIIGYTFDQAGPAVNNLVQDVLDMNLQTGISNSLDAKLESVLNALDDLNEHNDVAAFNSLQAFINAVEAQRGHKIPEADADALVTAAQSIIDHLTQ